MNLFATEATCVSAAAGSPRAIAPCGAPKVRIGFEAHWLREVNAGIVDFEIGAVIDPGFDAALDVDRCPRIRVRARAASPMPGSVDGFVLFLLGIKTRSVAVQEACSSWESFQQLGRDCWRELETVFGRVRSAEDYARVLERVAAFIELRNRILRTSLAALEWGCSGRLAVDPDGELPSQVRLQLYLPTFEKRYWIHRLTALPECEVAVGEAGAVVVRPRGARSAEDYNLQHQTALALGANSAPANPDSGFHLSFSDDRILERDQLEMLLQPILAAYGFSEPDRAAVRSLPPGWRRINVEFSLRVSGQAARAWLHTPKERSSPFNALFGDVSPAIQRSLRDWIPYMRCGRREFFSAKDEAYALLVYRASRIFSRRHRPEFTYDSMNRSSVRQACRNSRTAISSKLAEVRRFLLARGRNVDASCYDSENLNRIISRVQTGNRTFLNLLTADFVAVERLRKLGAWCRKLRLSRSVNPDEPSQYLLRAATEVNRVFRRRFKRLSTEDDLHNLGNLLLVEGTAAASEHFGRPAPMAVSVRLANADADGADGEFILQNNIRIGPGGVGIINVSTDRFLSSD
jgi:hypothetical protein